jgi:predicted ATPase
MKPRFKHPTGAHNLPSQPTPFVGRAKEVTEITRLLADPACRLLSLVGAGGIGKTRLAVQVATQILDASSVRSSAHDDARPIQYREEDFHGVYFVALQPLRPSDSLFSALADALKLPLRGQQDPREQVLNYLRDKKMLLVLDNFECLVAKRGIDLITAILKTAPAVKLLVTSQEALHLQEEWLYPVQGLPFPESAQTTHLEDYGAVQLFVERARRVRRDFSLAAEQAEVIRICQLVEGMPLALELAAAWTKTMRCAVIADEIQHNIDFLTTNLRNVPERQRSMQATFDHSWQCLTGEEQDALKRLSVFQGSFRRKAAEQVAKATLPTLSALVDKSLLRWEPEGHYEIHELLRQYGQEKLAEAPEQVSLVQGSHAAYYAAFLHERTQDMAAGRQQEAAGEIEANLENIRLAWQWATAGAKVEEILKSTRALSLFYQFQGRYLEGIDALEKAASSLRSEEPVGQTGLALATILVELERLYIRLGWLEKARVPSTPASMLCHSPGRQQRSPLMPLCLQATFARAGRPNR